MTAPVKPWPSIMFGSRRLSGIEGRAILEVLDLAAEILFGRFDAAVRTVACDLSRRIAPTQVETVGQLLEEASQALHPGRLSLRDEELTDLALLVERLRRLAEGDEEGYRSYHEKLRARYRQRLVEDRQQRRGARS